MRNTGAAAVALDDLLATMTDDQAQQLRRLVATVAPAFADQVAAAGRQAQDALRKAAEMTGEHAGGGRASDYPAWVRLGLTHALLAWIAGEGSTCVHDPSPWRPQPVMAAAWKPGLVTCVRCTHLLLFRPGSVEDRTCDCCGYVTTGTEQEDGIYPGKVAAGALIYSFGCCSACRFWDETGAITKTSAGPAGGEKEKDHGNGIRIVRRRRGRT